MKIAKTLSKSIVLTALCFCKEARVEESWTALLNLNSQPVHATHHVNNLIRKNAIPKSNQEKSLLDKIGVGIVNNKLSALTPEKMEMIYETSHFNIHYNDN